MLVILLLFYLFFFFNDCLYIFFLSISIRKKCVHKKYVYIFYNSIPRTLTLYIIDQSLLLLIIIQLVCIVLFIKV